MPMAQTHCLARAHAPATPPYRETAMMQPARHQRLDNRSSGISIGHRDTDNVIRDNDVLRSGKVGVLFRPERGKAFAGHRNRLDGNRVHDSGAETGVAIDVQGETESITLVNNQ